MKAAYTFTRAIIKDRTPKVRWSLTHFGHKKLITTVYTWFVVAQARVFCVRLLSLFYSLLDVER